MARKVALLIGVSNYGANLSPLPSAVEDVRALAQVLRDPEIGGFDQVDSLLNPNNQEMRARIGSFLMGIGRTDTAVLYFSGHGGVSSSGKLYFATPETRVLDGKFEIFNAVQSGLIRELIEENGKISKFVLILDCCFSGAIDSDFFIKSDHKLDIQRTLEATGHVVLTSCSSSEVSFGGRGSSSIDDMRAELSVYTRYLVYGLETGEADLNKDGEISTQEIYRYIASHLENRMKGEDEGNRMTPKIFPVKPNKATGMDIVLAKVKVNRREKYRNIFLEHYSSENSPAVKRLIEIARERFGLTEEEIQEIEEETLLSAEAERHKFLSYEEIFREELNKDGEINRKALDELAALLDLSRDEALSIEAQVRQQQIQGLMEVTAAVPVPEETTDDAIRKAKDQFQSGAYGNALEVLNTAILQEPESIIAYYERATVKAVLEDWAGAIADVDAVIVRDPDSHHAYCDRADYKVKQRNYDSALKDYDQAIQLNADYAMAYHHRGNLQRRRGYLKRAIADYTRAIKLDPRNADIHYDKGTARLSLGEVSAAISDFSNAIRLNPHKSSFYRRRAKAYESIGDTGRAKADLDQAKKLH